jgi:hypothetical protein
MAAAELLGAAALLDGAAEEDGAIDSLAPVPAEQAVSPTVAIAISPRAAENLLFMRFMSCSLLGVGPLASAPSRPLLVRAVMEHSVPVRKRIGNMPKNFFAGAGVPRSRMPADMEEAEKMSVLLRFP